jgi:hypothetical protein
MDARDGACDESLEDNQENLNDAAMEQLIDRLCRPSSHDDANRAR